MHLQLLVRGQKDFSVSGGAMGSYFYDVDFLDKTANLPVRGSGDVLYISQNGKEYLRTNTTNIDLGT
jgi:phenylalanyl-tRNA synthetase alpha subunit